MKEVFRLLAERQFHDININLTTTGKQHLGAVIEERTIRKNIAKKGCEMKKELKILTKIASTEPQALYCAYVSRYKHKFTYFISTIKQMDKYLQQIDDVIQSKLTLAITGGHICSEEECKLLSLSCLYVGLCIPILKEIVPREFENSVKTTEALSNQIPGRQYKIAETQAMIKLKIKTNTEQSHRIELIKKEK